MRKLAPSLLFLVIPLALGGASPEGSSRWTASTPERMLGFVGHPKKASLARSLADLALVLRIAPRALMTEGGSIGKNAPLSFDASAPADLAAEAALVANRFIPEAGRAVTEGAALGLATNLALLAPFQDTGGGLDRKDGPEADGAFGDASKPYSWGAYDVRWRPIPNIFASARGVPLGNFVAPRGESCSLIATSFELAEAKEIEVRAAVTGQARLHFDGLELDRSEEFHGSAIFDRLAGVVRAEKGTHLVYVKTCTGAHSDEGRVRIRLSERGGKPLRVETSARLPNVSATAPAKKLEKLETALTRALRSKAASREDALAQIILRTEAGADDAKSPRAPGLLAEFVRSPGLSADELAMAGWASPSVANGSGWLGQAEEQAKKENDTETLAFVERSIAAMRAERMADWARLKIKGAKTWGGDTIASLVEAQVFSRSGSDAGRLHATDLIRKLIQDPKASTLALLSADPFLRSIDPRLAQKSLGRLADRGILSAAYVEREGLDGIEPLKKAAIRALASDIALEDAEQIASELSRNGEHGPALATLKRLVEWSPNRAALWMRLYEEFGATGADPKLANFALMRARELTPGDARTRRLLAFGKKEKGTEPAHRDDERYLVPSSTILARRKGIPAAGERATVAERELHWLRAVRMHPDRRVSQLIHYAREYVVTPRTEDELVEEIPREGDITELLRAIVHRKDGGTALPAEEREESGRVFVRWPELQPGDTVEVAIRTWTAGPVGGRGEAPYYFMDYAGAPSTRELLYNEVIVESPKDKPIYVDVVAGTAEKKEEKDENGLHSIRLVWNTPPNVKEEPLSPPLSEIVPVLVGSTFHDWNAFRAWYGEAVRGFTEPDDEVRRLAKDLTKGKVTKDEKVKALFDFVADRIRYVNYVSGEAWLPNRPQQLLARREGDCDDKAILLITLLRAVGIEAKEVLVQTRETAQPAVLRAKQAAAPLFDHGIAFLPGPKGGTYLDATSPQSRLGPLPAMDARGSALRMDEGPAEIVTLPNSSPDDHGSIARWTVTLKDDGSADILGDETHIGDGAFYLRTYLSQEDSRHEYVENNLLAPWVPNVNVDKKIDFVGNMDGGKARVSYKASSLGLLRPDGSELVLSLSSAAPLTTQLAPLVERKLPVWLPSFLAPSSQRRELNITAPKGWDFSFLPENAKVDGGRFGRAELKISRVGAAGVKVERTVVFDASVIPPADYPAWRGFLLDVDRVTRRTLRLAKKGAKP